MADLEKQDQDHEEPESLEVIELEESDLEDASGGADTNTNCACNIGCPPKSGGGGGS